MIFPGQLCGGHRHQYLSATQAPVALLHRPDPRLQGGTDPQHPVKFAYRLYAAGAGQPVVSRPDADTPCPTFALPCLCFLSA